MKKIINLFTLGVFLISNIMTPLTNFIYAEENETLEESGELAMTRDMGDVADSNENIPETSPEETVDNPTEESNLPVVEPEVQPEEQTEDLPESTESHNSAVVPVEDNQGEADNPGSQPETDQTEVDQAQQEVEKTIEEEIEIMGECSGGQQYNENLDICYTQNTIDNVPVFYGTDMNTNHTYNNNPIGTITVFVPVGDEEVPITMMDMNLGATEPGTSPASYGNHYQWGNSYGFNGTIVKEMSTASYNDYRPGHRYNDSTFRYWTGEVLGYGGSRDYWGYDVHYPNLWGGQGDNSNTTSINTYYGGIKNGKNRQGPCPVGYHVPSAEEWNALAVYWYNTKNNPSPQKSYTTFDSLGSDNNFKTTFKLPLAGQYRTGSSTVRSEGTFGYYWTSSSAYAFYPSIMYVSYGNPKTDGNSIRCFKDSSDVEVHEVTFHDESGYFFGENNTEVKQFVKDGAILKTPTKSYTNYGNGLEFLGWTEDLDSKDYFNFNYDIIEEDMDLYGKWGCQYSGKEYDNYIYDGTKCTWKSSGTTLLQGSGFNMALKTLAKGELVTSTYTGDNLIKGFEWRDSLPVGIDMTKVIDISSEGSEYPVYAWFDTEGYQNGEGKIYYTSQSDKIYMHPLSNNMFMYMRGLTEIDLSKFDTSNVISMSSMFYNCNNLTEIDVSNFDTSNVTDMSDMFSSCSNLRELDLSNFDTSNVTYMYSMFSNCNSLTEIDVSNLDTSNVRNMSYMFYNCNSLTEIDVSNFDTSNVRDMSSMFYNCNNLTELDLSNFDTSNLERTNYMFSSCINLTGLDLSNWDTRNLITMYEMFSNVPQLTTIYATDKFTTDNVMSSYWSSYMPMKAFSGATSLVGGKGTHYSDSYTGKAYARIDGGTSNPGYFTQAYSITYNLDGGELQHPKTAYSPISTFTLSKPTKEFYTFLGWTTNNEEEPEENVVIAKGTQGDLEFTANWAINKYQIIFDVDGGNAIDPIEVEYNSSLEGIQLPTPTKEGYKFVGWNGLPETMPAEDITIVASWEQVSQGSYSSGGGSKTSTIDVVKATINDNTHNAADEKSEERTSDGKEGSNESSDAASVESNNSQEFVEAYNFAKTNGITTQSSIQKAKMNTSLTRIQMAKMLSYYAINVLGQTPDTTKTVKFRDVSDKRDAEYDNGVTLAYQLGIMGINMKNNKFRPNDEVTRAEFTTALSRMIYGMRDGTGKQKYYEPHMARLYNEGIINETNPKMKEKRGYVMIMLMRTVK